MNKPYRIVMLGKQGAGKGTQCSKLAATLGIAHISTGDMLRSAAREGTEFGKLAQGYMERGDLVPDEVILGAVRDRLYRSDCREDGFVLDGFPRTLAQAEALEEILAPEGVKLVINLDVSTEVVLRRLSSRRVCTGCGRTYSIDFPPAVDWTCDDCGGTVVQRADDTPEAISRRLAIYEELTAPLIAWYEAKGRFVTVSGEGDFDAISDEILATVTRF
ncbi:MAG: adenylate kinase [Nitrospiraceae bacterium]|nr:adenylate kinase [Nitrospiraceae bacterium]